MLRPFLARSLAVIGLVGATSLGIVYNSGPAQADGLVDTLMMGGAAIVNGVEAAAPEALLAGGGAEAAGAGAVCATGVGCVALGVIALGTIGYMTRDTWMPWVSKWATGGGESESGVCSQPGAPPGCGGVTMGGTFSFSQQPLSGAAAGFQLTLVMNGINNGYTRETPVNYSWKCQNTAVQTVQFRMGDYGDGPTITKGFPDPCGGAANPLVSMDLVPGFRAIGDGQYFSFGPALHWQPAASIDSATVTVHCQGTDTSYDVARTSTPADGAVVVPACNPGDHPVKITTTSGAGTWSHPITTATPSDLRNYPQCAGAACTYRVFVDGLPCTNGVAECTHWSYVRTIAPNRVECFYGPYSVAVDLCNMLERAYEGTPVRVTTENTDGNPNTSTAPAPTPVDVSDPRVTATTPPIPRVTETGGPVAECLNGTAKCAPAPVDPNPSSDNCWPAGYGVFNPASWVLQPTKCALKWAFVPRPAAVATAVDTVKTDIATSGPGPLLPPVLDVVNTLNPSGSGCQGPELHFDYKTMHVSSFPLDACSGWKATAAALTKAFLTMVTVVGGGVYIINSIASAFGYTKPIARTAGGEA